MTPRRSIAATLAATLLVGIFPGIARADNDGKAGPAVPVALRASIDRAAAQLAMQPSIEPRNQHVASAVQGGYPTGGGGGKGMLIVSLVTTVVGLAATYYVVKEMQKQTDQAGK
jgi:hypothetical protein